MKKEQKGTGEREKEKEGQHQHQAGQQQANLSTWCCFFALAKETPEEEGGQRGKGWNQRALNLGTLWLHDFLHSHYSVIVTPHFFKSITRAFSADWHTATSWRKHPLQWRRLERRLHVHHFILRNTRLVSTERWAEQAHQRGGLPSVVAECVERTLSSHWALQMVLRLFLQRLCNWGRDTGSINYLTV